MRALGHVLRLLVGALIIVAYLATGFTLVAAAAFGIIWLITHVHHVPWLLDRAAAAVSWSCVYVLMPAGLGAICWMLGDEFLARWGRGPR